MNRKKITVCLTVCVLVLALAGLFWYIACLNRTGDVQKGTLVKAFSQKMNACCL